MKKQIKKIFILQTVCFIIFLVGVFCVAEKRERIADAPLDLWHADALEYKNEQWHIEDGTMPGETEIDFSYGPSRPLKKGDYTVSISYDCEETQSFQPVADAAHRFYMKSESAVLDRSCHLATCQFRITEDIDEFDVLIQYNGNGDFTVSDIAIERNNNDLKRGIVYFSGLLVLVNAVLYYGVLFPEKRKRLLQVLVITALISLPLFYKGLNDGEDQDLLFHLMRIEGIAKELRCGHVPVRISSAWMGEYGYPVSVYYGDAFLYIPAMFRLFGFSVVEAYKIYVLLVNFMTVIISDYSFGKIVRNRKLSLLLALVYVTAPYRLVDVYVRAAVGEFTALMFLPLIALAVVRIYSGQEHSLKTDVKNAVLLMLGMTGLINTHVLTAEMVAVVLAFVCLLCIRKTMTFSVMRTYMIAVLGTLLLSAGFLVPFLDYYLNIPVNITEIVNGVSAKMIQRKGANLADYFAFFNNPFGNWKEMLFTPGLLLMATLILSVILWEKKQISGSVKLLTVLSVILLWMSSNLFPWDRLSHDFKFFDLLAQVQFPWRYLGIVIVILTVLLGILLSEDLQQKAIGLNLKSAIVLCTSISVLMTLLFVSYYADYGRRTMIYDYANMDSFYMMGAEYLRAGTDVNQFDGAVHIGETGEAEILSRRGCDLDVYCRTKNAPAAIELPVINYKGYVITDEQNNRYEVSDSENNLISTVLPADFAGMLYLRFTEPWYWTAASVISLITAVCITGMIFIYKKEKRR